MYFCRSGATERQQSASLSGYCINTNANPERLSLISSEVKEWLIESLFLKRFTTHRSTPTIDVSYRTRVPIVRERGMRKFKSMQQAQRF